MELKKLNGDDQSTLWEALYIALWDQPDAPRRPKSCLAEPHISVYASEWGTREMDVGLKSVAQDGTIQGIIWCRIIPNGADAHWDDNTPQLGLAVFPEFQGQGIGQELMAAFLKRAVDRIPGVSLGVHPKNEVAFKLYKKFGFRTFAQGPKGYCYMHRHCVVDDMG